MSKKIKPEAEVRQNLASRRAYGRSKAADKAADRERANALSIQGKDFNKAESLVKQHFYTRATYEKCVSEGARFLKWVRATEGRRVSFAEAKNFVIPYLETRRELVYSGRLSAGYLMTERAQLSKVYQVDLDKFECPPRTAAEKGRQPETLRNWSELHPDAARFYESVGLRDFEYKFLALDEAQIYASKCLSATGYRLQRDEVGRCSNLQVAERDENGLVKSVVIAHGKHGKSRVSEIIPANRSYVTDMMDSGAYSQFFAPTSHVPTQAARRVYAQQLYAYHARPIDELQREEIYCCRDGSGRVFDRAALEKVSVSLGHSEGRYTTVINNYMR